MSTFECDNCGACCKGHLIVEAYDIDLMREPKLAEADIGGREFTHKAFMADIEIEQFEECIVLAAGRPCSFHDEQLHCTIYPTRPNVCVAMQAGDEQCQNAREAAGLPLLPAIES